MHEVLPFLYEGRNGENAVNPLYTLEREEKVYEKEIYKN